MIGLLNCPIWLSKLTIQLFTFFSSRCFVKETENMYSVFLSSYTNTLESLGDEKVVETLAFGSCLESVYPKQQREGWMKKEGIQLGKICRKGRKENVKALSALKHGEI